MYIDGVCYIVYLLNTYDEYDTCVFKDIMAPIVDMVYVLEDYLGVRQILFDVSKDARSLSRSNLRPGMWWYTITVADGML